MKLEGVHHVTCITGDAPENVAFYAGTLGLRMVKKTVNQDDPTVYHLFYADERGSAGADITFFEYPGSPTRPRRRRDGASRRRSASAPRRRSSSGASGSAAIVSGRLARLRRSGRAEARAGRRRLGRAAADRATRPTSRRSTRLRGFAGVRAYAVTARAEQASCWSASASSPAGRCAATRGAASTSTTRRRSSAACRAPARCTTSRGRRSRTSTRRGGRGCSRPAASRRR